ncbi:MAG: hypothetical protein PXY39_14420 [archaeon]|nr:hypothetical protein [archaeon]
MSLILMISPVAVFASGNSRGGNDVASGCPALNGAMQQPKASFLSYSDSGGAISVQTQNEPNNALIAICVYPKAGIAGYSQTVDPSISFLWSTKATKGHLEWGRITGPDTLHINGATYKIGTVSPNPTIELVLAHVIGTECGGVGQTCFFRIPVLTVTIPPIMVPIAPQLGEGCAAQPSTPQLGTAFFTILHGSKNINITIRMQTASPGKYKVVLKYAAGSFCAGAMQLGYLTVGSNGQGKLQFLGNAITGTHEFTVLLFGPADYRSTLTAPITLS